MSKHTSGPLVAARENEYRTCIETASGRVLGAAFGDWGDTPAEHAEIEANAKLWAAAPELFAAWQEFLSAQRTIDGGGFMDNYTDVARARERQAKAIEKARAAIAKAEEA